MRFRSNRAAPSFSFSRRGAKKIPQPLLADFFFGARCKIDAFRDRSVVYAQISKKQRRTRLSTVVDNLVRNYFSNFLVDFRKLLGCEI
jgi:hypothetical protein